jgi:Zn-dependent protease/predicted transcriptional regulator
MKYALSLGKIAGIKISVHWTFAILMLWIVVSGIRSGLNVIQIFWSLLFIVSIFGCVVLHELGHALAAKRYKIKTVDITLLPIGGIARMESLPENAWEELMVAIAGPLVNFMIAILVLPFVSFPETIINAEEMTTVNAGNFMISFFAVNLTLGIFNLVPAFPMDGGRVLRALLSFRYKRTVATRVAATVGQVLAIGFVFAGFFSNPFLVFIGFFIFIGAQTEADFVEAKSMLKGYRIKDVLMRNCQTISPTDTIKSAAQALLEGQARNFLVMSGAKPAGTLSREEIIKALSKGRENETVQNSMNRELLLLDVETPLEEAFQLMQCSGKSLSPVMNNSELAGTVDLENILEFIMIQNATKNK